MALPEGITRQGEPAPPVSSAAVAAVPVGQAVAGAPAAVVAVVAVVVAAVVGVADDSAHSTARASVRTPAMIWESVALA
jgi:hypothetical protein